MIERFKAFCLSTFSELVVAKFCYNKTGYKISKFDVVYNDIILPFSEILTISEENLIRYMDSVGIYYDGNNDIKTVVDTVKSFEIYRSNDPCDFFVECFSKEIIDAKLFQIICTVARFDRAEDCVKYLREEVGK